MSPELFSPRELNTHKPSAGSGIDVIVNVTLSVGSGSGGGFTGYFAQAGDNNATITSAVSPTRAHLQFLNIAVLLFMVTGPRV